MPERKIRLIQNIRQLVQVCSNHEHSLAGAAQNDLVILERAALGINVEGRIDFVSTCVQSTQDYI